jgi:hypothetical protein
MTRPSTAQSSTTQPSATQPSTTHPVVERDPFGMEANERLDSDKMHKCLISGHNIGSSWRLTENEGLDPGMAAAMQGRHYPFGPNRCSLIFGADLP